MTAALEIERVTAGYGEAVVLDTVSLAVAEGRSLALLGRNGAGKSTLLKTIMGLTTFRSGRIRLGGRPIEELPVHRRADAGLGYVPQTREIFPSLSAEENLAVAWRATGWPIDRVYALFPRLAERRYALGDRLSGGEQQMLAIGRALAGGATVLLLDEPAEGLAPLVVDTVYRAIAEIRSDTRVATVIVEQKIDLALDVADEFALIDRGCLVRKGSAAALRGDRDMQARLLAVSDTEEKAPDV
jgi:branched-chain amino acid transport system ATP-binding protein